MDNPLQKVYHGGDCCGAFHIYNFSIPIVEPIFDKEQATKWLKETLEEAYRDNTFENDGILEEEGIDVYDMDEQEAVDFMLERGGWLCEVILQDFQLNAKDGVWKYALEKNGFKPVATWTNANTGNELTMFVHHL